MATRPRAANCAAYFSTDAAVVPGAGASTTAGALLSGVNPFGVKMMAPQCTASLKNLMSRELTPSGTLAARKGCATADAAEIRLTADGTGVTLGILKGL